MERIIPFEGQIRQVTRGDIFGEISNSFNVDLVTSLGKIKASPKLGRILSSATINNEIPQGLWIHSGRYYFLTNSNVYICATTDDPTNSANWATLTPNMAGDAFADIGLESDIITFEGNVLISSGTNINNFVQSSGINDNDWWTTVASGSALDANYSHMMHVHKSGFETLIVTDKSSVHYYNSDAGASEVVLGDALQIAHCITSNDSSIWVGTYNETANNAYVYEIYIGETQGSSAVYRNAYKVDGRAVLSIETVNNIVYIVTEKGHVQAFDGAGFRTVASLPFAYGKQSLDGVQSGLVQDSATSRPIHPKGMKSDGESLYFFLNAARESNAVTDPVEYRTHSGIWEFDTTNNNLNHRSAVSDESTDCGQVTLIRSGALLIANDPATRFLVGTQLRGTNNYGLFGELTETPCGFVETAEFQSGNDTDSFNKVTVKADTLQSAEEIVVKYKEINIKDFPLYATINWIDGTHFTSTGDLSAVEVGDEIWVTEQYGAGKLAHVTEIGVGSSTYTVAIDESIGAASQTSRARFDRWKLVPKEYISTNGEVMEFGIPVVNTWVKAKVAWEGDVTIREIKIVTEAKHAS